MGVLEFTLSEPVKVSVGGDFAEVDILELHAPPAKEKKLPIRLRKGFMKAAMGFADQAKPKDAEGEDEEKEDLKGSDIEPMLFASDIDIEKYMQDFRDLILVKGVCTIGDAQFLTKHWDDITAEDAMRLMGEYLAHFFAPSWIPKDNTTS